MNWKILDSDEQFRHLIQTSGDDSFAIFKHSTRCNISTLSKGRIERNWDDLPADFPLYYLDLLTHRPLSDAIAEVLDVEHESPQLLLIENGKCIFHASHGDINVSDMVEKVK